MYSHFCFLFFVSARLTGGHGCSHPLQVVVLAYLPTVPVGSKQRLQVGLHIAGMTQRELAAPAVCHERVCNHLAKHPLDHSTTRPVAYTAD